MGENIGKPFVMGNGDEGRILTMMEGSQKASNITYQASNITRTREVSIEGKTMAEVGGRGLICKNSEYITC